MKTIITLTLSLLTLTSSAFAVPCKANIPLDIDSGLRSQIAAAFAEGDCQNQAAEYHYTLTLNQTGSLNAPQNGFQRFVVNHFVPTHETISILNLSTGKTTENTTTVFGVSEANGRKINRAIVNAIRKTLADQLSPLI